MQKIIIFLQLFNWFSLRYMQKHKWRVITVIIGLGLGAAVFTGVRLSIHASLASFENSMDIIAGNAQWSITRPGGRISEDIISKLLKHPCIKTASPLLSTYVKPLLENASPFLLIGFDPILDRPFRKWEINNTSRTKWLDLLKEPYSLFISQKLKKEYKIGDFIELEHAHNKAKFKILSELNQKGLSLVEGGRIAITDISTFQEFTDRLGQLDRIDLLLKDESCISNIQAILPKGVQINSPLEKKESSKMMVKAYQLNLSILSFISLFVGMFLVYSLVALNAASRIKEIAILRAIGTSSNFIRLLFLAEGGMLGLLGWILGIPISLFLIKYLIYGVSQTISTLFVRVEISDIIISGWEIMLSFLLTLFISVLASWQPAREAMKVMPKQAFFPKNIKLQFQKSAGKLAIIGIIFVILVFPVSKFPVFKGIPIFGYLGTFLLFTGFALIVPFVLQKSGKIFLLFSHYGKPIWLAACYIKDSGPRIAISVGALITSVALFSSFVIMIYSFRNSVKIWVDQTVSGDLFVQSKLADVNHFQDPLPNKAVNWIKQVQNIDLVPYHRLFLKYNNKYSYQFEGMDFKTFIKYGKFFWVQGDPVTALPKLINGQGVLISEVFASNSKLQLGDRFKTVIKGVNFNLPVLGVIRDYRTYGGVVFYSLNHFSRQVKEDKWSGVRIFFKNRNSNIIKDSAQLHKQLTNQFGDMLTARQGIELRKIILDIFDDTFAVTFILLIIALVIAAIGIATTLTLLVLERSFQLNTLIAIGASVKQINFMIFWEALFIVAIGEIMGLICGFLLSYLLVFVINYQSFGWTFLYKVDWQTLMISIPLITITALFSIIPPIKIIFSKSPTSILRDVNLS